MINEQQDASLSILSIDEAMRLATALHRAGHREDAFRIYTRVLEQVPGHADALHFIAILAHEQGNESEAIRLMTQSVLAAPDHAAFRSNLGNLLLGKGRFEDAEREYRHALELDPDRPDVLNNYAVLCKALGRYDEAERCLLRALALAEGFTDARNNLARLYVRLGRGEEAVAQAERALADEPGNSASREMLGYAYCKAGRFEAAARVYRDWLADEPGQPKAIHHLAACTGEGVPPRASDEYVQQVFDLFADSFDARLAVLGYRAPALVVAAVADVVDVSAGGLRVLDAGCGTGLCAPLLRPFADRLTGVDLSARMLVKARQRGLYDLLEQVELTAHLRARTADYDLIVSADTLVYFGVLEEVIGAAAAALSADGLLCFTLEALGADESGDYRLRHHGRYAHARAYLESVIGRVGLIPLRLDAEILRSEGGEPVAGWLVLARRPAIRA